MKNYIYSIHEDEINSFKKKRYARAQVAKAVRSGVLKKSNCCERCKEVDALDAHHVDYGKPLEVIWLCDKCHGIAHKKRSPMNPANNKQTELNIVAEQPETITVTVTVPIACYIVMRHVAEAEKKPMSQLLRENFMHIYQVKSKQLELDLRPKIEAFG